ncbi:hypothetical protein DSM03_10823 [Leeuwenhoekiella aestuarii]|uniref:hypothetical protein n=1 Tax=Leeuwenhoekiella aestuarii TaxID=2249426 RepID=UPI000FFF0A42|nr:hypothetical protein [Leeuwenhoekiella aestuarii]RXG12878.1 hypothetical protein DSM03_10823 [Leeuwenhoekiella aestuarii]
MKWILIGILSLFIPVESYSQTPEKLSYQAIVRDSENNLIIASEVAIKIDILSGSPEGNSLYQETHYTTTNENGLVTLEIGTGTISWGGFDTIDWGADSHFIKTQIDPTGTGNYTLTGVTELLSVPYALYAKQAETITGTISASQVAGLNTITFSEDTASVFDAWDQDVSDDFDGTYAKLTGTPEIYTKTQVDSMKIAWLKEIDETYLTRSKILDFRASRTITPEDIGNTISCTASATLTISKGFDTMKIGDFINLEAHNGSVLTIATDSGVKLNYTSERPGVLNSYSGNVNFGLLRKQGPDSYIISGQQ